MSHMGSPQALSESDRRIVAAWAAACAERVLALFEAEALLTDLAGDAEGPWAPAVALAGGKWLLLPEYREEPRTVKRTRYGRLSRAAGRHGWVKAYAQYQGLNLYVDPLFLCREAAQRNHPPLRQTLLDLVPQAPS